jgi:hypothetical protein
MSLRMFGLAVLVASVTGSTAPAQQPRAPLPTGTVSAGVVSSTAAPITPDGRDVANEFHLVQDRLAASEKLEEERLRSLSEKVADVKALLFGLAGLMTLLAIAAPFLQSKLADHIAQRNIDASLALVERQIEAKGEAVLAQINERYKDPHILEDQITGHIVALMDPHALRQQLYLELITNLADAEVITPELAKRLRTSSAPGEVKHA